MASIMAVNLLSDTTLCSLTVTIGDCSVQAVTVCSCDSLSSQMIWTVCLSCESECTAGSRIYHSPITINCCRHSEAVDTAWAALDCPLRFD